MRRLHVVQVSFHADAEERGAEALLRAWPTLPGVAAAAANAGVDVTVVQRAHKREIIERDGITYHFVNDESRVLGCVASLAPDVVHVQGLSFPRAMRPLSRCVPGVPLLVQDHGSVAPAGLRAIAWRWGHRPLAGVVFTARAQATPWKRARILRADLPVFEVLEGSTTFTPGDRDAARRATKMFGEPCFFWTGRLNANKDPLTMLRAFEQAATKLPDARLWCCFGAAAPLLGDVKARIAQSAILTERVTLLGARPHEEMESRFRAADFYLQASHHEGSGYALLEALACGTTPLVTDIPAARMIVGGAGSLTPVGEAAGLAEAIVDWGARDARALRVAARARFDAALTFDVIGRQLRGAYEAVAGEETR